MSLRGYIVELTKSPNQVNIGPVLSHLLLKFAKYSKVSTYDLYKYTKNTEGVTSYKNVHKKVHQLLSNRMIEQVVGSKTKVPKNTKDPIYYRLSSFGIFYIFNKLTDIPDLSAIITNYENDELFRNLLYPYFQKSTLLGIKDSLTQTDIASYLSECCKLIEVLLASVDNVNKKFKNFKPPVFQWNEIPGDKSNAKLLSYLRNRFDLDFPQKNTEIKKRYNDKTISISSANLNVHIDLNDSKTNAALIQADKGILFEFNVQSSLSNPKILEVIDPKGYLPEATVAHFIDSLLLDFDEALGKMVYSWVIRHRNRIDLFGNFGREIENDFRLIADDRKFMKLLERIGRRFIECFKKFPESISQSGSIEE